MVTFAEKVYKIVKAIPKGKVLTYKTVAQFAGSPRASRAVGNLMKKNYDPKIFCHRVIRTDGFLGGYNRGGLSAKEKFLRSEGAFTKDNTLTFWNPTLAQINKITRS